MAPRVLAPPTVNVEQENDELKEEKKKRENLQAYTLSKT